MTLLLERSPALDEGVEHGARRRLDGALLAGMADAHGRLTLDDVIVGAWEGLAVRGTVTCPVCVSPMMRVAESDDEGVAPAGTCDCCGSRLS